MNRAICVIAAASTLIGASCGRGERSKGSLESTPTVLGDRNEVRPRPVSVEGCVTASGDRFVLTALVPAVAAPGTSASTSSASNDATVPTTGTAPESTTETYRLVGMADQLKPLLNQRARIAGEAEPEKVVDVRNTPPPTTAQGQPASGSQPEVSTVESTKLTISDLLVRSVTPTGEACAAGGGTASR